MQAHFRTFCILKLIFLYVETQVNIFYGNDLFDESSLTQLQYWFGIGPQHKNLLYFE
jgi:hypothetical protein